MLKKILQPFYILYVTILFLTGLVIVFITALILGISDTQASRKALFTLIKGWSRVTLAFAFAPLKVIGKPPGGRYVMVSNHNSYLDPIDLFSARPEYFKALGKIEIAKTPLFGFLYKRTVVPVDRSSPESRRKSMNRMLDFLKNEGNIFIYPEGTFSGDEAPLKDFYDGAFRLAINAQVPIVPFILPDAATRWPAPQWYRMWPGPNRGVYLDPVNTAGMTQEDLAGLKQKVYTLMKDAILKYQAMV